MNTGFTIGKGNQPLEIQNQMLMRHGLITGATGTGKTVTLKVLAENLSEQGIQVFLADVKGDLASLAEPLEMNEKIQERLQELGVTDFTPRTYPVTLWDVYGKAGVPVRASISEMGPMLLSRLLGLNDTQSGVLDIAFRVADKEGWLLLDLDDLKAILGYLSENASAFRSEYGNIAPASVGAIMRSIISLEEQDGGVLIGEPALNIADLLQKPSNEGMIHILQSQNLYTKPLLYSTLLLWMLSELYEELPEVGNIEKPKIVFFFDEAHLLFDSAPKVLVDKIEMMVRLIRSKGVGIFFITQSPLDIPDAVLAQLGNKIQHALRAYTPKELKNVRLIAQTFRESEGIDVAEAITSLKTGQAVVSPLDAEGIPKPVDIALIYPPKSKLGTLSPEKVAELTAQSPFLFKYKESVNRESAYEMLSSRAELAKREKEEQDLRDRIAKEEAQKAKEEAKAKPRAANREGYVERFTKNIMGTAGREVGRAIMRGIFGTLKR